MKILIFNLYKTNLLQNEVNRLEQVLKNAKSAILKSKMTHLSAFKSKIDMPALHSKDFEGISGKVLLTHLHVLLQHSLQYHFPRNI